MTDSPLDSPAREFFSLPEMKAASYERVDWDESLWNSIREEFLHPLRRTPREKEASQDSRLTKKMLLEILSISDGMERLVGLAEKDVLESNPVLENWLTSIRGLHRRMMKSLEKMDIHPIASLGRRFDVHWHEAIEVRPDPGFPPATIIEVREKPYRWGHRILRVGKVVVTPKSPALSK